jgi:hypothetical protein
LSAKITDSMQVVVDFTSPFPSRFTEASRDKFFKGGVKLWNSGRQKPVARSRSPEAGNRLMYINDPVVDKYEEDGYQEAVYSVHLKRNIFRGSYFHFYP